MRRVHIGNKKITKSGKKKQKQKNKQIFPNKFISLWNS